MKGQRILPKARSDTHTTPARIWDLIYTHWKYRPEQFFDPCPANSKFDGLKIDWNELNYVNPPYSLLGMFVDKAINESFHEKTSIMLLPSKTDQKWFHKIISFGFEIKWIQGRLKFANDNHYAFQPHFLTLIEL